VLWRQQTVILGLSPKLCHEDSDLALLGGGRELSELVS
jgi:hypothetical protein